MLAHEAPIFRKNSFSGGKPSQEAVTVFFTQFRESLNLEEFPILCPVSGEYEFFSWEDPVAKKIWKPYIEKKVHVKYPSLDSLFDDDDDLEYDAESYLNKSEFFQYQDRMAQYEFYSTGSDDFEDPLSGLLNIVSNPFTPDTFEARMDQSVWQYLAEKEKSLNNVNYSDYSIDLATTNLQILTNPSEPIKAIRQDSVPLSKAVYSSVPEFGKFKFALQFCRYLSSLDGTATEMMRTRTSISNALDLINENVVLDCDNPDLESFLDVNFPQFKWECLYLVNYVSQHNVGLAYSYEDLLHIIRTKDISYDTLNKGKAVVSPAPAPASSTVSGSPVYVPQSPPSFFGTSSSLLTPGVIQDMNISTFDLSVEQYTSGFLALAGYMFFREREHLDPSTYFIKTLTGKRPIISRPMDLFKFFRKKHKCVFFSRDYKHQIWRDISSFLASYTKLGRVDLDPIKVFDQRKEGRIKVDDSEGDLYQGFTYVIA